MDPACTKGGVRLVCARIPYCRRTPCAGGDDGGGRGPGLSAGDYQ